MDTTAIVSLVALLMIVLFTARGAWRGLLRTIAGFLIMIIALIGARYIASAYAQPAAEHFAPVITESIAGQMSDAVNNATADLPAEVANQVGEMTQDKMNEYLEDTPFQSLNFGNLISMIREAGGENKVLSGVTEQIGNELGKIRDSFVGSASEAISVALTALLTRVIHGILYAVSFLLISVILNLLMLFINPIIQNIPVVGQINAIGGGVIGFIEGALLVCLVLWILEHFNIIAPGALTNTVGMFIEKIPLDKIPLFGSAPA